MLTADSSCDLGDELKARYHVQYYPGHVSLDGVEYADGVDLTPDDIFRIYKEKKVLPTTTAINVAEYLDFFRSFTEQGYEVIHLNLGSGITATHQNARLAAAELTGVWAVDSHSLSTGFGMLVMEAGERIARGMDSAQVVTEVEALRDRVQASFVLDSLEFLYKGGRCSALSALGANLLQLKPCIEVDNRDGSMHVGKKYRGTLDKSLETYAADKLKGRNDIRLDKVFITHTGISEERIAAVKGWIAQYQAFENIYVTRAGATITTHSGPNTLGILFITK